MNDGFVNEKELRDYINSNNYLSYNRNIQDFLRFMFGEDFSATKPFVAEKITCRCKPDLRIIHNNKIKYISIKKGSGNSVHQESIDLFFPYIESLIGLKALNHLKKFHYGDDTLDDTGAIRYDAVECRSRYCNEISELNAALDKWSVLEKFLDRFLFIGNVSNIAVDVVYHGNIDYGLWASREEIKKYVKENDFTLKAVHFGPLTYQVWGRNEKRMAVHPERRYVMQVKWGSIESDLKYIRYTKLMK